MLRSRPASSAQARRATGCTTRASVEQLAAAAGQHAGPSSRRCRESAREAVMVGARELAEDHRVEAIGLAARDAEAGPRGFDLVGMQREHDHPASSSRSTNSPSGRSIATRATPARTVARRAARCRPRRARRCLPPAPVLQRLGPSCRAVAGPVHARHSCHLCSLPIGGEGAPSRYRCGCSLTGARRRDVRCRFWRLPPPGGAGLTWPSTGQASLALSRRWSTRRDAIRASSKR